jgi:excinuclease ABC subunit C
MKKQEKYKPANLPRKPGVYMMKDKKGKIIYIGKAKNLKNRVSSYFQNRGRADTKTATLVAKIADVDLLVTDSEIEALILEANLVKEHKPRYNVNLKDDKRYPYLKLTVNEPFPRLLVARRVIQDGARYFGPYTSSANMRRTMKFLMRHFGIRSCNFEIPSSTGRKYKVCLDYHIGRCAGACVNLESRKEYKKHVNAVIMFLSGRRTDLIENLRVRMEKASERMEFEEAARLRDTIEAMEAVRQKQKVDSAEHVDRDVIAYARDGRNGVAVVLQIREGILIGRQDLALKVDAGLTDGDLLSGFLKQYYNHLENLPKEVYIPGAVEDSALMEKWLSKSRGSKVRMISPQIGEKQRLVGMAETNARLLLEEILAQKHKYKDRVSASTAALQKVLNLKQAPKTISCFDISNLGATDKAASLVYFEKGKPKKSEYRHFKIKTVEGQDDFAAMREVFTRYVERRQKGDLPLPDLMMVDGGKGQLSIAGEVLGKYGLNRQPVIGLAKRLEEVFIPGKLEPVSIPKTSPALNLLKRVRDEAHRFAISYHRKLRAKRTVKSDLDIIPGIGEARRNSLLKYFGSVKKLKKASVDDITAVKGIPKKLAQAIFDHFQATENK